MKKVIKEIVYYLLVISGIAAYFRWKNKDKITILMYHGIVEEALEPFCWTQIPKGKFEYQLKYFKKNYSVLKLSEVIDRIQNGLKLPDYTGVITFDDGYKNNLTIAYPILKQLQVPGTIFLVTGGISNHVLCWPDILYLGIKNTSRESIDLRKYGLECYPLQTLREKEIAEKEIVEHLKSIPFSKKDELINEILKLLSVQINTKDTPFDLLMWEEIKIMSGEGLVEFGAHTVFHNILSQMDGREMEMEIIESCKAIEQHLGVSCQSFAYPNGRRVDFNSESKEILKAKGVICSLSTIPGLNDVNEDLYELKRLSLGADISNTRFKCLVSGLLSYLKEFN